MTETKSSTHQALKSGHAGPTEQHISIRFGLDRVNAYHQKGCLPIAVAPTVERSCTLRTLSSR
jgi:hypothetical protein